VACCDQKTKETMAREKKTGGPKVALGTLDEIMEESLLDTGLSQH